MGTPNHCREDWLELTTAIEALAASGLGPKEPVTFDDVTPVLRKDVVVEASPDGFSWDVVGRAPLGDLVSFRTRAYTMVRVSLDLNPSKAASEMKTTPP